MTRRRSIVLMLGLASVGLLVIVGLPRAVIEWYIYKISSDRKAYVAALEAPPGSWEWSALEAYSRRSEGQEVLRFDYVRLALSRAHPSSLGTTWFPSLGPKRDSGPDLTVSSPPQIAEIPRRDGAQWALIGLSESRVIRAQHCVADGAPEDDGTLFLNVGRSTDVDRSTEPEADPAVERQARLAQLVLPSDEPVLTEGARSLYVVRLDHPVFPERTREPSLQIPLQAVVDPDWCVVFITFTELPRSPTVSPQEL